MSIWLIILLSASGLGFFTWLMYLIGLTPFDILIACIDGFITAIVDIFINIFD